MASQDGHRKETKILVVNPNTSEALTKSLEEMIKGLGYPEATQLHTYTAAFGPESINNDQDALDSASIVYNAITYRTNLLEYDGFVIACYSAHPLTKMLNLMSKDFYRHKPVVGIFEASISTALSLLPLFDTANVEKFGIVTTGKYWEEALTRGVLDYLGCDSCKRFKGVESTGLSAAELHTSPPAEVRRRLVEATKRLIKDQDVDVICLGCAGMAGMDAIVREACVDELGEHRGKQLHIVDGVKAGIAIVEGLLRAKTR